ncbi:50S ribosomal protein L25/general stress protein Ctc [Corynebacterium anserum]|uniref:Large ribosomal subunit protein bL25 n=1 Tax=Corynebacterium anserum TaxID=2684406 RepID=A0A7G7YPG2_9CORY|nr:50S ribosomal protein L25/general stress protein Ctc [Corynebacterium anserum]MBC2682006.1 50S ribosomal protein L25/general stress protein Ctc [Corynebacterium anserum]QNH96382.1 50S ribosomal protein L25/general stress protein Ctc [Corynebacterium anserum]
MATNLTVLAAQPRNEFGKGAARRLRRDGRVPVVVYGLGLEPMHVHVDILEFQAILRNEGVNAVLELEVEGEQHLVMVKAVDQNVLTLNVDHADLLNVKRGEKVEVDIPVVFEGEPAPGALVTQDADVITVLADVLNIPEEITIDVEGLEIGHQITAGDIQMPANCELVTEADHLIINIVEPQEEELPEPGEDVEEPAEPEADNGAEDAEGDNAEGETEE